MSKVICRPILAFCQKVGARRPLTFNWTPLCAKYWEANERYEVGECVRPTTPNGFQLRCTRAGWTNAEEPTWAEPEVSATVYEDGSVQWTAEAATADSIARTVDTAAWDPIIDVTITDPAEQSTNGEQKTWAWFQSEVLGTYRVRVVVGFSDGTIDVGEADLVIA